MRKIILLFLAVITAITANAAFLRLASQRDFPPSNYNQSCYRLMHQSGNDFTTLVRGYKSPSSTAATNWATTTTLTLTNKNALNWETESSMDAEKFYFVKGSEDGKYKMYMSNNNSGSGKSYFNGFDASGMIKTTSVESSAKEVEVAFVYGTSGTVHYDGKEFQLVDGKMLFADSTDDDAKKVYLYFESGSMSSISSYTINLYTAATGTATFPNTTSTVTPATITVSNTSATTIYAGTSTNSINQNSIFIVAEGEQPSDNYVIKNASEAGLSTNRATLTFPENTTPGTYSFTAYYLPNGTNNIKPKHFSVVVKGKIDVVWCYGNYSNLTEITPDEDGFFNVEWNPGEKFFNLAEKENGRLSKIVPTMVHIDQPSEQPRFLSTSTGSNTNVTRGLGFTFVDANGMAAVSSNFKDYPYEVTYSATCDNGAEVPDLKLRVSQMKPDFSLKSGNTDFQWSAEASSQTFIVTSPNLNSWSGSVQYIVAKLVPAFNTNTDINTTLPDGAWSENSVKIVMDKDKSTKTQAEFNMSGIPCSGLYNLVLTYSGYTVPYVDPTYESIVPLNIYPTADGLQFDLFYYVSEENPGGENVLSGPVNNDIFTGYKDFEDADTDFSVYGHVGLSSTEVAGIDGWYKAETAAAPESTSLRAAPQAPEGYAFTNAASHQYMNLFGVDKVSIYVGKNGAIAPVPIEVTIDRSLENTVTSIEAVGSDTGAAPLRYFDLRGCEVNARALTPGIYIVRKADGSTAKIAVK